jgi:putative Ca2+/H+ antiporter (TMEM165/GDT1 family)
LGLGALDIHLVAQVYGIIFVAELPDKTALASLVLATRHKPLPVFLGACLALTVQSLVAVAAGQALSLLPPRTVHVLSGLVFLGSAVAMWRRSSEAEGTTEERDGDSGLLRVIGKVFVIVFVAEWGDLTQFGTAALAAHYRAPLAVFLGSALALWSVVAVAVFLGNRAARWLDPALTKRVAALLFGAVGAALLLGWL